MESSTIREPSGRHDRGGHDRLGRQASKHITSLETEEMLRRESFPPNDDDQCYEQHPAGCAHTCVAEQAVE